MDGYLRYINYKNNIKFGGLNERENKETYW